ncbi:hypothetical protein QFZ91_000746 [Paraburkholderia sp. JPY419]
MAQLAALYKKQTDAKAFDDYYASTMCHWRRHYRV